MATAVSLAIRNALVREGVRRILSDSWFDIVETVDDLADLDADVPRAAEGHILVIDRSLLGTDGAATVAAIRAAFPRTRVVTLVDTFDYAQMVAIYGAGAYAYFLDYVPYQALVAMMQMVAIGQKVAPPELIDLLGSMLLVTSHAERSDTIDTYRLNERERAVLGHLGEGLPNKAIARDLGVSESAMKATVKSILKKLGVRNRTQAAVMARELTRGDPLPRLGGAPGNRATPQGIAPGTRPSNAAPRSARLDCTADR